MVIVEFLRLRAGSFSFMHLHMRTTIDVPDELLERVRPVLAQRRMTFRALVIDAVERAISAPATPFKLRDASVGPLGGGGTVSSEAINRTIHELQEPAFQER